MPFGIATSTDTGRLRSLLGTRLGEETCCCISKPANTSPARSNGSSVSQSSAGISRPNVVTYLGGGSRCGTTPPGSISLR